MLFLFLEKLCLLCGQVYSSGIVFFSVYMTNIFFIGDYLMVLLPGYFVHLLNVGIKFEPCQHILLHGKFNVQEFKKSVFIHKIHDFKWIVSIFSLTSWYKIAWRYYINELSKRLIM